MKYVSSDNVKADRIIEKMPNLQSLVYRFQNLLNHKIDLSQLKDLDTFKLNIQQNINLSDLRDLVIKLSSEEQSLKFTIKITKGNADLGEILSLANRLNF